MEKLDHRMVPRFNLDDPAADGVVDHGTHEYGLRVFSRTISRASTQVAPKQMLHETWVIRPDGVVSLYHLTGAAGRIVAAYRPARRKNRA